MHFAATKGIDGTRRITLRPVCDLLAKFFLNSVNDNLKLIFESFEKMKSCKAAQKSSAEIKEFKDIKQILKKKRYFQLVSSFLATCFFESLKY